MKKLWFLISISLLVLLSGCSIVLTDSLEGISSGDGGILETNP